jgi:UDPglucose 6-dehydrogenase
MGTCSRWFAGRTGPRAISQLDAPHVADALVLITKWNGFRALAPARLRDAMRGRALVDPRNVYHPIAMREA